MTRFPKMGRKFDTIVEVTVYFRVVQTKRQY